MYHSTVTFSPEQPQGMHNLFADREDLYPVRYIPDIVYAARGERKLHLQLMVPGYYRMKRETEKNTLCFPLVIYVQGSGWRKQDIYGNLPQLVDIARAGYVVASIEYRGSDEAKAPGFLLDIKTAVRFLKKEAGNYLIDKERIAIWGTSSGAHGAMLAALTNECRELNPEDYPEYDSKVQAVIDFYGPTELSQISDYPRAPFLMSLPAEQQSEAVLLGGTPKEKTELAEKLNPLRYIQPNRKIPPCLILHGDEDEFVPFNQSVRLYKALRDNEKQVFFYRVNGALHGDRLWSPQTIRLVIDFLRAYL